MTNRCDTFQRFRDSIPRDRICPIHGWVTRYHGCKLTEPGIFRKPLVATSEWVKRMMKRASDLIDKPAPDAPEFKETNKILHLQWADTPKQSGEAKP